jgi:oligopeptide/dipeptide ABC transporter ATP-binding protein
VVTQAEDPLIEVKDLKTYFYLDEGTARAVDGVTFAIPRGKTLGVVGESGCGKSVTARSILRIVQPPGRIVGGEIIYHRRRQARDGSEVQELVNLTALDPRGSAIRAIRGNEIAMIFQEPMTAFSPVHTIGNQLMEAIKLHQKVDDHNARVRAIEMLARVGVPAAATRIDDYPLHFSGGMRQRAMIAMALSCRPSLLIADEPTTALDVTTEAQILELLRDIQQSYGMAMMYITHNLGVIAELADEVVVMYMGRVVEHADVASLFEAPQHPYTQALLRSIPRIGQRAGELEVIAGMVPDPYRLPRGCKFHPRCREFEPGLCDQQEPSLEELTPGHHVRCLKRSRWESGESDEREE